MPLTCYCEWEPEPGNWCWYGPDDYSTFEASRRKRCSSCHNLIDHASIVAKFERRRIPATDVEVAIFGEEGEIPLAPFYLCEECADLWFSFHDLGFECVGPEENMRDLVKEYAEVYGPKSSDSGQSVHRGKVDAGA